MGRQATGRATIVPTERSKDGKTFWVGRGQVPIRGADGSVGSRRVERGFDESITTARQREQQCARWNQEYQAKFENPRRVISFAKAWDNYIAYLGEDNAPLYEVEILQALGARACDEIDDAAIAELVKKKFPRGAEPATINRHILTPVLSCLRKAMKERAPQLTRPKGYNDVKPVEVASPEWFQAVMPELSANLQALVLFLAAHGRRIGEALGRRPHDLDGNILDFGKTKTGLMTLTLEPQVLDVIKAMPGWRERRWLFGYGPKSHGAVYKALKAATRALRAC